MKLSLMAQQIEQRVCIYGPPLSGKTLLAGKLAEHYKLLFFSLENGVSTLTQLPIEWQDRIEVINIRDSRQYPIAIETMLKVIKGDEVFICEPHSKVKCPICSNKPEVLKERVCIKELGPDTIVIIDSLTQLTMSGIAHVTKNQADDYKPQQDDWGALKVLIEKFLTQIQVARYNVVCITHEEEVTFEDGRKKIVPTSGSSNSSRNTAKYFDHVVYVNLINKKHVIGSSTEYSTSVLTGSRTNVKLELNKEATLLDIFTSYKLPNFGATIIKETTDEETKGLANLNDNISTNNTVANSETVNIAKEKELKNLTPAQRAIENLRAKRNLV